MIITFGILSGSRTAVSENKLFFLQELYFKIFRNVEFKQIRYMVCVEKT